MRPFAILFALVLLTLPALAIGWQRYENARFGYTIEIPPGFEGMRPADNADGQGFSRLGRAQGLAVWGGHLLDGFEAEAQAAMAHAEAEGWNPGQRAITPNWAEFTGFRGQRARTQRMIVLCEADQYAAFALEYSVLEMSEAERLIERLARTLRPISEC